VVITPAYVNMLKNDKPTIESAKPTRGVATPLPSWRPHAFVVALPPSIVEPIRTYVDVALIIVEPTHGVVAPRHHGSAHANHPRSEIHHYRAR
jgi:hypothetical protein